MQIREEDFTKTTKEEVKDGPSYLWRSVKEMKMPKRFATASAVLIVSFLAQGACTQSLVSQSLGLYNK